VIVVGAEAGRRNADAWEDDSLPHDEDDRKEAMTMPPPSFMTGNVCYWGGGGLCLPLFGWTTYFISRLLLCPTPAYQCRLLLLRMHPRKRKRKGGGRGKFG